jgi:hypothetical protein
MWRALRAACDVVVTANAADPDRALRMVRMFAETPSLQARHLERQVRWSGALVPEVARRLGADPDDATDPRPRAIVAAALGSLEAAIAAWRLSDGHADLGDLLDRAIGAVASCSPSRGWPA